MWFHYILYMHGADVGLYKIVDINIFKQGRVCTSQSLVMKIDLLRVLQRACSRNQCRAYLVLGQPEMFPRSPINADFMKTEHRKRFEHKVSRPLPTIIQNWLTDRQCTARGVPRGIWRKWQGGGGDQKIKLAG